MVGQINPPFTSEISVLNAGCCLQVIPQNTLKDTRFDTLVYALVGKGAVETCRERDNGFLVGVRTKPYLVEHYLVLKRLKIGESVEVHCDPNHGFQIREIKK